MAQIPAMKCSRCGKEFIPPFVPRQGGKVYCKDCTNLIMRINILETRMVQQEFSIEKTDEQIAVQINQILERERTGISKNDEDLLSALTERLLADEKRRKKIVKEILKLQKKKH